MQDKASFEFFSKAWGNSTVRWLHSWLGIDMDVVCLLVTEEIDSKQTAESLDDNTWERKGPCIGTVCVGRLYVFIHLCTTFGALSPISTWEGSQRAAIPLKSSQHVCLCQALACFRDYIFSFPFLNSPCLPQRNSATTHPCLLAQTRTFTCFNALQPYGEDFEGLLGRFHAWQWKKKIEDRGNSFQTE